jgi:sugar-specific transcriptional regulator TrmB
MKEITQSLIEYGLTPEDAKIYTFLLSHKDYAAYKIAQGTNIPRTTVYKRLVKLEKDKLVSSWVKNGVKHFSAETPEVFRRNLKSKEQIIDEIVPSMLSIFKTDILYPKATLYEGKDGVKQVFEQIIEVVKLKKIKRLYVYTVKELTELFPIYFENWRKRKDATGAYTNLIVPYGTEMNISYASNSCRETRIMPQEFPFDGSVSINGDFIAFFSFKEKQPYAITITSDIISNMLTQFFQYTWSTLKPNPYKN